MDASATIVLSTATNNSLVSGDVFGIELTADPTQNASLAFSGLTVQDGAGTTQITPAGISFPDATTQTTAGIPDAPSDGSQYARKDAAWEVVAGGGGVAWGAITGTLSTQTDLQSELDLKAPLSAPSFTSGITSDGGLTVLGPSGNPTFTYSGLVLGGASGGITFADASVQSTAAVAPPSADVLTANAIAANVNFITGSTGTWVGIGLPSIAGLIGWGIYNPTDGLIAYSYSTGSTFYLASAISTSNNTVQISGSNSSFYVA
jgi:hypothetical protein